jgi:hypothetical protein
MSRIPQIRTFSFAGLFKQWIAGGMVMCLTLPSSVAATLAWWRMQEATSGFAGPGGESPEMFLDSAGSRHLNDKTSNPQYSNISMPITTNGVAVTGNLAYSTGYNGGQGLFTQAPGFLNDTSYTWETFFRRSHSAVSANFYGNDKNDHYNGISRVGVTADGDVVLQLTGNDVGNLGNTPEEFVFPGPDDAAWHHFAFTYSSGVLQGFVDYQPAGVFVPQFYTNGRIFTDFAFLTVGFANESLNGSLGTTWSGDLDEIRNEERCDAPSKRPALLLLQHGDSGIRPGERRIRAHQPYVSDHTCRIARRVDTGKRENYQRALDPRDVGEDRKAGGVRIRYGRPQGRRGEPD